MFHFALRRLSRLMPLVDTPPPPREEWVDTDSSCHNSSYELASGLQVIEHFGAGGATSPAFADTMPAFQHPPRARKAAG